MRVPDGQLEWLVASLHQGRKRIDGQSAHFEKQKTPTKEETEEKGMAGETAFHFRQILPLRIQLPNFKKWERQQKGRKGKNAYYISTLLNTKFNLGFP